MLTQRSDYIIHLDGFTNARGGWINGHWVQLAYQLAASVSVAAYTFLITCLILYLLNLIPVFRLRVSVPEEILGIDDIEIGEFAVSWMICMIWSFTWLL